MAEVEKHDSAASAWFVHNNKVRSQCMLTTSSVGVSCHTTACCARLIWKVKGSRHACVNSCNRGVGGARWLATLIQTWEELLDTRDNDTGEPIDTYMWNHSQSLCVVQVYDATPFLRDHPGGGDSILIVAGTDATEEFNAIHSDKAKTQLLEYCIGELADENVPRASLRLLCWATDLQSLPLLCRSTGNSVTVVSRAVVTQGRVGPWSAVPALDNFDSAPVSVALRAHWHLLGIFSNCELCSNCEHARHTMTAALALEPMHSANPLKT